MEVIVYNPQKGRLETINAEFTHENTTWFDNCLDNEDIYMITDFQAQTNGYLSFKKVY